MSELFYYPEQTPAVRETLMSVPRPVVNIELPEGYALYQREVLLLNGQTEPAFYSTKETHSPNPDAWEDVSGSIMEGFLWALQAEKFLEDGKEVVMDDDIRTQEIGNMMSFAMSQGLTEDQVLECYKQAFVAASE